MSHYAYVRAIVNYSSDGALRVEAKLKGSRKVLKIELPDDIAGWSDNEIIDAARGLLHQAKQPIQLDDPVEVEIYDETNDA